MAWRLSWSCSRRTILMLFAWPTCSHTETLMGAHLDWHGLATLPMLGASVREMGYVFWLQMFIDWMHIDHMLQFVVLRKEKAIIKFKTIMHYDTWMHSVWKFLNILSSLLFSHSADMSNDQESVSAFVIICSQTGLALNKVSVTSYKDSLTKASTVH